MLYRVGAPLEIIKNLESVEVPESYAGEFECELSREDAEGTWYFENKEITPGTKYVTYSRRGRHSLCVKDVKKEDQGKYTFKVGDLKTSASLKMKCKLTYMMYRYHFTCANFACLILWRNVAYDWSYFTSFHPPVRPVTLIQGLSDLTVCEGDIAQLEVRFSQENVEGTWMKNGQPISATDRIHIVIDKLVHKLLIENATKDDAGTYSFNVPAHFISTTGKLTVQSKVLPGNLFVKPKFIFFPECFLIFNCTPPYFISSLLVLRKHARKRNKDRRGGEQIYLSNEKTSLTQVSLYDVYERTHNLGIKGASIRA